MDVQTTNNLLKYKHDELNSSSPEYKFIKNFFDATKNVTSSHKAPADFKVYKITENSPTKVLENKHKNLMLCHGTSVKGVNGILKDGFKNSEKGLFGRGVYMTDCSCEACTWSGIRMKGLNIFLVFVNEVLVEEKLHTLDHDNPNNRLSKDFRYSTPEYLCEKHVLKNSQQITEAEYKEDALGRRYRNVPHNSSTHLDEYVADESVTVPRYLIQFRWNY